MKVDTLILMSGTDTISRSYFQYNVVASHIESNEHSALVTRVLAAMYTHIQETTS